ncbi:MAG TPA: hypothetical protein VJ783_09795 [Pirellulales bacterium]|nr:hypothetical protein [Pirellulales bacterium]
MIEFDRLRYDLVHGTPETSARPAPQPSAAVPQSQPRAAVPQRAGLPQPWLATCAGALLAGYGLTRRQRFWRIGFLSAAAGLLFYGWDQRRTSAALHEADDGTRKLVPPYSLSGPYGRSPESLSRADEPLVEMNVEHPVDLASQGSFPASDPPSLSP